MDKLSTQKFATIHSSNGLKPGVLRGSGARGHMCGWQATRRALQRPWPCDHRHVTMAERARIIGSSSRFFGGFIDFTPLVIGIWLVVTGTYLL